MMNKLTSKDGHISHAELPAQLLYDTKKRSPSSSRNIYTSARILRLAHEPDPLPASIRVHSLLRKNIVDNILRNSDGVSLTVICKIYQHRSQSYLPRHKKMCARDDGNFQEPKLHQSSHHSNRSRSHTYCKPVGKGNQNPA